MTLMRKVISLKIQVNFWGKRVHNAGMDQLPEESKSCTGPPETWGPYKLRPNPLAILRLSIGTAGAISTALVIPDILQMLFSAPESLLLVLRRSFSLWSYASILWSTGFLCFLHIVRIFSQPLILDSSGIKIGRFSKILPWQSVKAVNVVERKLFSRLFFTPAFQLTIHYLKPDGKSASKQIASFVYTRDEFYSLFFYIAKLGTGAEPKSLSAFVFKDITEKNLLKIAEEGKLKRLALSVVITIGLITFLGRKSLVNYDYNMGNKEFNAGHYAKSSSHYLAATAVDRFFAPAWDGLARSEFRLGDSESAQEHWLEALKWKPDFVEAKLGLSRIYMLQGKLEDADKLVNSAARLAPLDEAVFLNRAQLDCLMGKAEQAIAALEQFVKQKTGRQRANCILARAYLKAGKLDKAETTLAAVDTREDRYSESFCSLVKAELALEQGKTKEAAAHLTTLRFAAKQDPEILVDFAMLSLQEGELSKAKAYLSQAEKIAANSPCLELARAELTKYENGLKRRDNGHGK